MIRLPNVAVSAILLLLSLPASVGCSETVDTEPDAGTFELAGERYPTRHPVSFKLPKALREISGLTAGTADELYAVNDEAGIVFRIDPTVGRILDRRILSGPPREDFEGIAVVGTDLYLVTSAGILFHTRMEAPEKPHPFERFTQTLDCEVEGLTFFAPRQELLVACKNLPGKSRAEAIRIHRWSLTERAYLPTVLSISVNDLQSAMGTLGHPGVKKIQPTGIAVAPNGNLVIVAGRQHLLLELTPEGELVNLAPLDPDRHRQAEGIAITGNRLLVIADEGDSRGSNKSRGRLSVYEPIR
jgi:hypothetical protein